jgi:hypothetical protein
MGHNLTHAVQQATTSGVTLFHCNHDRATVRDHCEGSRMRRREASGLESAAVWPAVMRAQQGDRVRRIGVLMPYDENDPMFKPYVSALTQALADLGCGPCSEFETW